jgi:hypothetical protein
VGTCNGGRKIEHAKTRETPCQIPLTLPGYRHFNSRHRFVFLIAGEPKGWHRAGKGFA